MALNPKWILGAEGKADPALSGCNAHRLWSLAGELGLQRRSLAEASGAADGVRVPLRSAGYRNDSAGTEPMATSPETDSPIRLHAEI